jgi:hypothetical protein
VRARPAAGLPVADPVHPEPADPVGRVGRRRRSLAPGLGPGAASGPVVVGAVVGAVGRVVVRAHGRRRGAAVRRGCGIGRRRGVLERLVELLLVEAGSVERVAAAAVRQREARGDTDVVAGHDVAPGPGRVGAGGAGDDEVRAHPVDVERGTDAGDLPQHALVEHHLRQPLTGVGDARGEPGLGVRPVRGEGDRVVVEGETAADDLGPLARLAAGPHLDGEAEPVEELRAQLALLRVHRADQQEPRGVRDRDALALHVRAAHGGGVQQDVDEVVAEQVDLVDVEQAAVRRGEQAGLEGAHALGERALQVQGAEQAVLAGADRQLDEAAAPRADGGVTVLARVRAVRAGRVGGGRVAGEAAAVDDVDRRQQRGERADRRRLRRPLLAADEDAAHVGGDGVEQEGGAQVVHADDGRQRERGGGRLTGLTRVLLGPHEDPFAVDGSPRPSREPRARQARQRRGISWLPVTTPSRCGDAGVPPAFPNAVGVQWRGGRPLPGHSGGTAPESSGPALSLDGRPGPSPEFLRVRREGSCHTPDAARPVVGVSPATVTPP